MYTGSPQIDGQDVFRQELEKILTQSDCRIPYQMRYHEIDPDIFGEELAAEAYDNIDRLAAVGVVISVS